MDTCSTPVPELPAEIWTHIISYTSCITTMKNISRVSKQLHDVVNEQLWAHSCLKKVTKVATLKKLSHLPVKHVDLQLCKYRSDLGCVLSRWRSLSSLTLGRCSSPLLTSTQALPTLSTLHVKELRLVNCNVKDRHLVGVGSLRNLQKLSISEDSKEGCKITDAGLVHLRRLTQLHTLHITDCYKITKHGMAHLGVLTQLHTVNIGGCRTLHSAGIKAITHLPIRTLYMYGCVRDTDHLSIVSRMKNLTTLDISNSGFFFSNTLKAISNLQLQELHMRFCIVDDSHLAVIGQMKRLKILNIGVNPLATDPQLERRNLPSIAMIDSSNWSRTSVTDLSSLSSLVDLEELDISGCSYVTSNGISSISSLTKLRRLNLSGCRKIDNDGLNHICGLVNLQELNVSWCPKVTVQGLDNARMPKGLHIIHSIGTVYPTPFDQEHVNSWTEFKFCCTNITGTFLYFISFRWWGVPVQSNNHQFNFNQ